MRIANTGYYINATKYFRSAPQSENTVFGEDGFTYIDGASRFALSLTRTSKSIYLITIIYNGETKKIEKNNILNAAEYMEQIVKKLITV